MSKEKILVLLSGIPGSGKSTWAQKQVKQDSGAWISRDEIRLNLLNDNDEYFSSESKVFKLFAQCVQQAIDRTSGPDIIYADATHLNEKSRNKILDQLDLANVVSVCVYWFEISLSGALSRNKQRLGRARVPEDSLIKMFNSAKKPTLNEKYVYNIQTINQNEDLESKIFLTSDLHFGHDKEFIWKSRDYLSVEDMNEGLVQKWNEIVSNEDDVYLLGDVMMGDPQNIRYLHSLNGKIHIVLGNHDTDTRIKLYEQSPNVVEISWAIMLKYNKHKFFMTHCPCITTNLGEKNLRRGLCNFFGHTHQTIDFYDNIPSIYHVGVDSHNGCPVLIDDAISKMYSKASEHK